MEAEALAWLNLHSSADGCWPEVVGNKHRGRDWYVTFIESREKSTCDSVSMSSVGCTLTPKVYNTYNSYKRGECR